jgi:hypothetical protein
MEDLSRYNSIVVDTETSGLYVWKGHSVLGVALGLIRDDGKIDSRYYPFGHDGGDQYTKQQVVEFVKRELVGKKLIFHNSVFDLIMMLRMGVDLRQVNEIHDTMFAGILVNPNTFYSLDGMYAQYVDKNVQKIILPFDKDKMQEASSNEVGDYAELDVTMTGNLHPVMQERIRRHSLESIYRLECDCAEATTEMMNNGLCVDAGKLHRWVDEVDVEVRGLEKKFGDVNPNSSLQLSGKFDELGIDYSHNYSCVACSKKQRRLIEWVAREELTVDTPEGEYEDDVEVFPLERYLSACPYCKELCEAKSPCFSKEGLHGLDHPYVEQLTHLRGTKRLLDTFLKPWSDQLVGEVP